MKKIVPAPPVPDTTHRPFGKCDAGHPPLFSVNPNINAQDALTHAAEYLRSAYDVGYKALEHMDDVGKSLQWANLQGIELAEGLVEAMLDGIEDRAMG
ncbi:MULTISPECIES: DUF6124 family protein [Pseudomonas]|uniref:DUF3077 domain-containing protein n=1 Tax=Pseudomonas mosselii TaxID=78327 RepID=A0A5R8YX41_9PSED|nr:DUF3077 domain-containing protein [Pseudomonas mosselii]TLP57306.1 DUF3077 domain-containing protein [Pseudomonas mosselii]